MQFIAFNAKIYLSWNAQKIHCLKLCSQMFITFSLHNKIEMNWSTAVHMIFTESCTFLHTHFHAEIYKHERKQANQWANFHSHLFECFSLFNVYFPRTFSIRTITCICSLDSFLLAFVVIDARKSKEEKKTLWVCLESDINFLDTLTFICDNRAQFDLICVIYFIRIDNL